MYRPAGNQSAGSLVERYARLREGFLVCFFGTRGEGMHRWDESARAFGVSD